MADRTQKNHRERYDNYPKGDDDFLIDQCRFDASFGRCGLRGTIRGEGNWLLCSFHHSVQFMGDILSLEGWKEFLRKDRESGSRVWDHHDEVWWWDRVTGRKEPFTT